jgi:thymidylate synthase
MLNRPSEFYSLDDLLYATYTFILENGNQVKSKRGGNKELKELINYSATLVNPKIRTSMSLDRKLVKSKFAEFAWYLSKEDDKDYIKPYISLYDFEEQENNKILGAYGSKIFGSDNGQKSQYERVIEQILKRKTTKQAYLVISEKENYKFREDKHKSPPCTIGLHFYVRDSKLNLTCYMRSNDAYYGLPHDLFCFTMLQELISFRTNIPLGIYTHNSTSMHIYDKHIAQIKSYLEEGKQEPIEMPSIKDCSSKTLNLVSKEFDIKFEESYFDKLDDYWKDFVLFSNKFNNNSIASISWKKKFNNKSMKLIATNSKES